MDRLYSTRRRTALVFTGTGTAAAYHAGALRALTEAGIKVDLVAGQGAGAVTALFAAVDGGARLWEPDGFWAGAVSARFYRCRASLYVAGWALVAAAGVLAIPLIVLLLAVIVAVVGLLLTLVGLATAATVVTSTATRWIDLLFSPLMLPTIVPRLAVLAALIAGAALVAGGLRRPYGKRAPRRFSRGWLGRIFGGPFTSMGITERCDKELWQLVNGTAAPRTLPRVELGRRYLELLGENLGQPGFRELLITVHDMDARRDLVLALLDASRRPAFFTGASSRPTVPAARGVTGRTAATPDLDREHRELEALDLGGPARDRLMDALHAALAVPLAVEPTLMRFAASGPWRGERHRVCDRPGALARLLEEVAAAGAEQVIVVSACPAPGRAHDQRAGRGDLRGRAGEQLVALESAALRDALEHGAGRFAGLFVIRPAHNPLGPLDFAGIYDERSDRTHQLAELLDRGYEDAYQQFIEPVIGDE